jgi:WD40 repeat protein
MVDHCHRVWDRTVRLWRAADGELLRTLWGHTSYVTSVTFSPDSSILAAGSGENTVRVGGKGWYAAAHVGGAHGWNIKRILLSGRFGHCLRFRDNTVRLWQAADGELLRILEGHTYGFYSVAFSPDDKLLASGAGDRTYGCGKQRTVSCCARWKDIRIGFRAYRSRLTGLFLPQGRLMGV